MHPICYMGAYEKINSSQAKAIRKLHDYHVFTQGRQLDIVRIHREFDVWGESDDTVIDTLKTNAVIIFPPGEMPLIRLRELNGSESTDTSALYFYDILPTEAYFKWEDKIETGDVFFFVTPDEQGNNMPVIFKVLDQKGAFSSELIWRKFSCAPITSLHEVDTDIAAAIQEACKGEDKND